MKKMLIAGVVLASASSVAFAVTDSASVPVGATISPQCSVSAVSTNSNVTIAYDQNVAQLTLECNVAGDITLDLTTANGDSLVNTAAGVAVDYSLDLIRGDEFGPLFEFTALNNFQTPASFTIDNSGGALIQPAQLDLRLNIDGSGENIGGMFAGTYEDTITMVITAS